MHCNAAATHAAAQQQPTGLLLVQTIMQESAGAACWPLTSTIRADLDFTCFFIFFTFFFICRLCTHNLTTVG